MAWGTAQEGASLWALMHALPKSKLLEAGLFCVDQACFPKAWGFKPGELPPMGASPDGLLFHSGGLCQVMTSAYLHQPHVNIAYLPILYFFPL